MTSTCSSTWRLTRFIESTGGISRWTCFCHPGRRPLVLGSRWKPRAARPRSGSRPAPPPASVCGSRVAACPKAGVGRATCTPRYASWCRPTSLQKSTNSSNSRGELDVRPPERSMSFALDRPRRLDLETFGRAVDLHPDLVRRLVTLGLLDAATDTAGRMWFRPREVAAAFRIQRLRSNLSLKYRGHWRGGRPPRPHHRPRGRNCGPAPDKSETTSGHEPTDPEVPRGPCRTRRPRASRLGHTEVDGEHLLLALLDQPDGLAPRLLADVGADLDRLRGELETDLARRPKLTGPGTAPARWS